MEDKSKGCALGESIRQPRRMCELVETNPVKRVYLNIVGPIWSLSFGEVKYFVTVLDKYSGFSMVRFLHRQRDKGV